MSVGATVKWLTPDPASPPTARPSTPVASSPPPTPPPAVIPPSPVARFTVDDKGFVNSDARCEATQTAVALGRTPGSLVVICGDSDGHYGYRGVRLSDDALLKTVARTTPTHKFIAQNAGVTYTISPAELLVTAGGAVLKHEPMVDYRALTP
ncbi:MAG TPA: hypothetical protein VE666_07760 [Mycobacterium sp.]|nr:hypothetical protein [Mycobacterium sp.]